MISFFKQHHRTFFFVSSSLKAMMWAALAWFSYSKFVPQKVKAKIEGDTITLPCMYNAFYKNPIIRFNKNEIKKRDKINEIIKQKIEQQGFNGAVLIVQNGKLINKTISGFADIPNNIKLNENSVFQLASVSKTFTAVACMYLQERGKIRLNDTLQKYLPTFPYKNITVEMLLTHRSGLPNYIYDFENYARKIKPNYPNNDSILQWFANSNPLPKLYAKPNSTFGYNNTNYMLLASVIEKVTQLKFHRFMRDSIFLPLGMKNTFVVTDSLLQCSGNKCFGHKYADRGIAEDKDFFDEVLGDKGVYSTVDDMYKWYYSLQNACLLKSETIQEMFAPRSFERKGIRNYGYGFRTLKTEDEDLIFHNGWWKGFMTTFWMSRKDNFCIIVLGNKYNRCVYDVQPIISILRDKALIDEVNETEE